MMKGSNRARRWTVVVATAMALTMVGVAFAAPWTAESNGKARAKSGRLDPVVASEAAPTEALYPGESADAAVTLTNPNPVAMVVTAIVGNGPITSDSTACDAAGHGVTFIDATGSWSIAKGASLDVSLPAAVQMALDSAAECQDVTFSIPVRVTSSVNGSGGGQPTTTTTTTAAPEQGLGWDFDPNPGSPYPMGQTRVGDSRTASFHAKNYGSAPANALEVILTNHHAGQNFTISWDLCSGVTLQPGHTCQVIVKFTPDTRDMRAATLEVRSPTSPTSATKTFIGFGE
jgi:hypothetical protein